MQANQYEYLKFVRFRELDNWSARYMIDRQVLFNHKFQLNKLSSFLNKGGTITTIDDNGEYKRITVKTKNGGVCLRDIVTGKNIGTKKQWLVSEGLFIISKIDARNGALGIIPKELNDAIVTNDFPVFNIDKGSIVPQYLLLVTTTERFVEFVQKCSSGTTNRQRVDVNDFLDVKIPLPTLSEQQALVEAYNSKIKAAEEKERRAEQLNKEIEDYLLSELGIKEQQYADKADSLLEFVRFKDVDEWGYNLMNKRNQNESYKYKTYKVKEICSVGSGGTPSRSCLDYYKGSIPWIKTGEVINEEIFDTEEHISQDAINNSSAKLYPKGSLIIAMYGQGDTRGRTAKLGIDATTNQACAVLFNMNNLVNADYLWLYFQGRYDDLRSLASGNNQPNLNAEKISNYEVIAPPLEIQNAIVKHITELKEQIKQLKQESKELRENALVEFEKEIFEN